MNSNHSVSLFKENIFSDLSITLKDANQSIHIDGHRIELISNDYFKNLLTGPLKENYTNELTLKVFNAIICKDIIMTFYGIPIDPIKFSNYRYALEYVKCCDYWLVPYDNVLTDDLKVPEEEFHLLLEIGELMNYSDRILKIISRNIPLEYDLNGIPVKLKMRMIKLNQINCIASGSSDNTIKIWDLDSCKESEGFQSSWETTGFLTGILVKTLKGHTNTVWSICYIPEKNQIASGSSDDTIKIWDLDTGTEIKTLTGHTDSVLSICYIPDKNQIVSGSIDKTIKIWDLDSNAVVKSLKLEHSVDSVCHIKMDSDIAKRLKN